MATLPKVLLWTRTDVPGAETVVFDDRRGLVARGTQLAVDPIPYQARYELVVDENWQTSRLDVSVEGAGFMRTVRMQRATGRWRATTGEQGDLDAALVAAGQRRVGFPGIEDASRLERALDVDLGGSPLTNTLPIRRLGLLNAAADRQFTVLTAWVLLPSLEIIAGEHVYTRVGGNKIRYESDNFRADMTVDDAGFVVDYPGLAKRG
ncbi:putative glycolipid-binding domain-containing protein [Asanoa sp. WMMD1127]|uniref:putative glycolipid-binding domain-containing protein n=1 Tax=Asanoa sp. WMMD1127 TaxID=3016107 RepID=UPI002417A728|nr:putative glycolipid-binding domain-containing protein [Asanoa sp. WMMD1127]MDG4821649.1 putative glycolipid-binding domain-containing protein [Asanoa sp. WMMD1127]